MFSIKKSKHNPIIKPDPAHEWESFATFNGCPINVRGTTTILYRASSAPKKFESTNFSLSTIGKAVRTVSGKWTTKGQLIFPVESWERYGCEDPRVSYINGTYYVFYTALSLFPFRGDGIKVAVALSKDLKTIQERHLVTPFNAKAMSLFPEKIGGKYTVIFALHTDDGQLAKISLAQFEKIEDMWNETKWNEWYKHPDDWSIQIPRGDNEQVEIGAPPIRTPHGWLLVYSHIKNYFSDNKIFGIGAVLLDAKNPKKVIAQTKTPFIVPETEYEKKGTVPNITFPSGAILEDDKLEVFYGGADTVCASAEMSYTALVASMTFSKGEVVPAAIKSYRKAHTFARVGDEPLLTPDKNHPWESRAVLNPAAIEIEGTAHILYRAMSDDNTSTIGHATSQNLKTLKKRDPEPIYTPRAPFEEKRIPGGNSGCEDARVTLIDDRIYMTYTAYNGVEPPAIALTSIKQKDFVAGIWEWSSPILISKNGIDDKDGALFPDKINDKYALIHRVNHAVCIDYSSTLEFKNRDQFKDKVILAPRPGMWDSRKVGIAMPPFISEYGWIMLYHGIGDDGAYRVGAALLNISDTEEVISRTAYPLFEAETEFEKKGEVNNVVFPCGAVVREDTLYIYYGGADSVVGVATIKMRNILESLGVE